MGNYPISNILWNPTALVNRWWPRNPNLHTTWQKPIWVLTWQGELLVIHLQQLWKLLTSWSSSSSSSQPLTFHTFHQWVPQDAALHSRGLFPIPHPAPTASASAGWATCPCKPSASGSTTNVQGGPGSASSCGERYSRTQQKKAPLNTWLFWKRPSNCMLDRNSKNELSELTMKPSQPQNLVMAQTPNLLKTPLSYSHCWPVEGVQSYRVILWLLWQTPKTYGMYGGNRDQHVKKQVG